VVWVTELFTPSTVAGLFRGIEELGWESDGIRNESLVKWMYAVREGRLAGWINLGPVAPQGTKRLDRQRTAPLPAEVLTVLPTLMSVTPSVTALVTGFVLRDEHASSLNEPLRAYYSTREDNDPSFRRRDVARFLLRGGGVRLGRRIRLPDTLRREATKERVASIEGACADWVRRYFAGAFASLQRTPLPTAVLFVTEHVAPLTESAREVRAFAALSIDRHHDAWESSEWPGVRMVPPLSWNDEGRRLVFACRRGDARLVASGDPAPQSNEAIAHRSNERVNGLLSRWALTCVLEAYRQTLAILRDKTAGEHRHSPVRDLKALRSLTRSKLYDVHTVAHEIDEFTQRDSAYRFEVMEMSQSTVENATPRDLLKELQSSQRFCAVQLKREADLLQATMSVAADVSQTISNIRTQRLVLLLTVVSIGIAIWAVVITLAQP
jgi:hypothetical protein